METQIQQAVEIASGNSSTNDPSLRQQALDFIQQFKLSDNGWQHCLALLKADDDSVSLNMKFFMFQVFDERVPFLADPEKLALKDALFAYLKSLIAGHKVDPAFLRNALAKTLGLLFVHCTLSCYPTLIKDLLALATTDGVSFDLIPTDYYLKTLVIIHQEIGDQMIVREKQEADRNGLLKDFIRDNNMVGMTESWRRILQQFTEKGSSVDSGNKSLASEIVEGVLTSVGLYSSWIDINLILDPAFLSAFYNCLASDEEKVQVRAIGTFIDILHKKMSPSKKLELINFLNLGSFLNQMQFDIKDLDFTFAQNLAKLCEQLGSECIDVLDRSSHDELKFDDFRRAAVAKVLEVMPLNLRFLEYEYDDISVEVFPFFANYLLFLKKNLVNEDLDFYTLSSDEMLSTLLKKIILKARYDQDDDGDDDESIELFNQVRSKLTSFQDSIVIINDSLSLDIMIDSVNEFLFKHLEKSAAADWRDIELGLYQLNYFSEMLRNNVMNLPKTMINASRPYYVFNEMLCKVVDNSTEILINHPLIQLLFFELVIKHYTFFTNSNIQVEGVDKSQILLKVLKIFVSNFGIFSDNAKVKYRTWYLFYRFIRLTRPKVGDFVITELVQNLMPVLSLDFEVASNKNTGDLHDIDLTLVEETGSFENQLYLMEAIGVLITIVRDENERVAMTQSVMQPLFSTLEKCINNMGQLTINTLLQAHHSLLSIGTIVKGFEQMPANLVNDGLVQILQQVSEVVLITLEKFEDFNIEREACSFCMIRLFTMLSKLGTTHSQTVQDVLSKYVGITMNGFDKRKLSEVSNFVNFVAQLFHFCATVEPLYGLLSSLLPALFSKLNSRIELEGARAQDDFVKRDVLELQKWTISLVTYISSDNLTSLWVVSEENKQALETMVNVLLNYSYNYTTNDASLVKQSLSALISLNHALGTGKVIDPEDRFRNDNNVFEKASSVLVGNSILICLELTFKLQNKELLRDAQFRNGVLLEVTRLLKTIAYIGNDPPTSNAMKKESKKAGRGTSAPVPHNDATCQQIRDALVGLGYPVDGATEFVSQLIACTDKQFAKFLVGLVSSL